MAVAVIFIPLSATKDTGGLEIQIDSGDRIYLGPTGIKNLKGRYSEDSLLVLKTNEPDFFDKLAAFFEKHRPKSYKKCLNSLVVNLVSRRMTDYYAS